MPREEHAGNLTFGDVVVCPAFAYTTRCHGGDPLDIVSKADCRGHRANIDEARGTARFMVINTVVSRRLELSRQPQKLAGPRHGYGAPASVRSETYLVRLDDQGKPTQEVIKFSTDKSLVKVTLIGRMKFGEIDPVTEPAPTTND